MEDMIGRIIELGQKARSDLNEAKLRRIESEQKINDMKNEKRAEYLERARTSIKSLEKSEKIKAFVRVSIIERSYKRKRKDIERIYSEKKEEWINALFDKIVEQ